MFSRFLRSGFPTIAGRRWWNYRSIANNLAFLHILAVFISFACASVILYNHLFDHLNEISYKRISEELDSVRAMLLEPNGFDLVDTEIRSQMFESESHKVYIRLVDRQDRIIKETLGMSELFPVALFSPQQNDASIQKKRLPGGKLYVLINGPFSKINSIGQGGQVHIGKDISKDEWLAREILWFLFVIFLGVCVFAVISAFYIVNKGLKPLSVVSDTIEQITEYNLNAHIDLTLLPIEMESLGKSFNILFDRIDSSFKKLSQYSENLAHELRTPLNNLMLEADVALSQQRTPEEYQQIINSSMEEYGRLSLLIDRLLFLVRVDNNQLELTRERIDVRQEFENIVEFYAETILDKGIAVNLIGKASLSADPVLFTRVVSNLFTNALNYTERGGSITLAALQTENSTVEVVVNDTGCGIDPELLPKIFDRYFWVEASRKKEHKGTGLGLDIVKAIMKLHGGSVAIQSELGRGTTMTLLFPLDK
jgi:two-component system heavy metal sensor histidine kinase CusS